ncbi:cupredoxin domain-containing protein [Sphingomonas sp. CGMCC 1.13654]|uniref:Cupredoxin domain-containing protein n=1 Tax=Sphingomonas chungangi TaxID=2683589 RepID=A0A838L6A8_9SPHN|nr:cupredoxin domain-containing protein [Sphingomonas chungangi]MBA2934704.1 cupredoxin domain-containing protein [Sphingomonas chungangi]MVW58015.1 hypothetical protein [Sphingomonas chungangi]
MKLVALAILLSTPLFAPAAVEAAPAAQPIPTRTVVMQDRKFHPQVIRLRKDVPTRIVLVNRDMSGHNFSAKGFFGHADIRDSGAGSQAIREGIVTVRSESTRSFVVTPRVRGPFDLTSSVALDVASGMQGQILVY